MFIFYVGVGYIYRRNLISSWSKAGKKFIDLDTYSDLIYYIFLHALNGGRIREKSCSFVPPHLQRFTVDMKGTRIKEQIKKES